MAEDVTGRLPRIHGAQQPSTDGALDGLDGVSLLAMIAAAASWLDAHVAEVNALNVFPVPDGDTGTNMTLTMRAAIKETSEKSFTSASELSRVLAYGALMGARGNSGVILSQILRGFARGLDAREVMGACDLAEALRQGSVTAYKGVMKPVEGTMLTVIREASEAAIQAAGDDKGLVEVLEAALAEARVSLERTPSLLPVLAAAGVVDAGGQGLVYLLEGMWRHLRGEVTDVKIAESAVKVLEPPDGCYNYDTQFILKGDHLDVDAVREVIAGMGDSVLVVGDADAVKVHVHCDHPGNVLEFGLTQGQITDVVIENMQLQYEAYLASQRQARPSIVPARIANEPVSPLGVVAVGSGEGLCNVMISLGANAIVPGGQTMNPSTQDLVEAIEAVPSSQVILLPNNSNILLTAEQAKGLTHKCVSVVPTRTMPQGIAALLAFNYQADIESNTALMTEAGAQVQTIEVTRAVRSAQVNGLTVQEGQFIGLLNDDLVTVGKDSADVVKQLLERLDASQYEIMTIYYGADMTPSQADSLGELVRSLCPGLEVQVLSGGQPHYHLIISLE